MNWSGQRAPLARMIKSARALAAKGQWALVRQAIIHKAALLAREMQDRMQNLARPAPAVSAVDLPPAAPGERKVLWFVPTCATGGAEEIDMNVMRSLRHKGWRVLICCETKRQAPWRQRFSETADALVVLDEHAAGARNRRAVARELITSWLPDAVVVRHSKVGYSLLPFTQDYNIATSDIVHTVTGFGDWIDEAAPHRSAIDLRIATTKHVVHELRARGGASRDRILFAPNGFDHARLRGRASLHEQRSQARAKLAADRATLVIGYLGRLSAEKNLTRWLAIAAHMAHLHPCIRFVIVGDGPMRAALRRVAHHKGIARFVTFTGPCLDPLEFYPAFDAFMLTSDYEGLPMSVIEATCCGVPALTTAVGDLPSVLEPPLGHTLPLDTSDAEFAQAGLELAHRRHGEGAIGEAISSAALAYFDQERSNALIANALERAVAARG